MGRTDEQEEAFHSREWRVQRVGWVLIAGFIALAVAGLFGGGPLSEASVSSADAGTIDYERYTRHGARTTLTITPAAQALQGNVVRVTFPRDYLDQLEIEEITPEPTRVRMSGERLIYEFAVADAGSSISILARPEQMGRHRAQIVIGGAAPLTLSQLTYP